MKTFDPYAARKTLPLAGHKCDGAVQLYRVYCECGWGSSANPERAGAYGEWREHVLSHGGEKEPMEKWLARKDGR